MEEVTTEDKRTVASSFGDEIAGWTLDQVVAWLLDLSDRLRQREAFMIHLVQNEFDGTKLVQLFRKWQWEWERSAGGVAKLCLKSRPRDIDFGEEDSRTLHAETIRLCGRDPAIVAEQEAAESKRNCSAEQQKAERRKQEEEEENEAKAREFARRMLEEEEPEIPLTRSGRGTQGEPILVDEEPVAEKPVDDQSSKTVDERKRKRVLEPEAKGESNEKSLRDILAEMELAERQKREEEEQQTLKMICMLEEEERREAVERRKKREMEDEARAKEFARLLLEEERRRSHQERQSQEEANRKLIEDILRQELEEEKRRKLEDEETSARIAQELQAKEEELKEAHCEICMDDFDPMDKFIMGKCGHYYCRDCSLEYFKSSLHEFPIKCPHCSEPVSDEALELILPADIFKKYEKFRFDRALQSDKDFHRCLSPDCENGVIIPRDEDLPDKAWQWKCDVCTKKWCLKCNDDTHDSTCSAYQEWKKENGMADDKFQELITTGLLKLCPHCQTRTQKTEGCNFMTCQLCKQHWCWQCGLTHAACPGGHNSHK